MATSRREPQPNARTNRPVRNMSPVLKPSESDQGLLRRARSVPSSPDHRSSASTAGANSANASRPSSSFNPRAASSRSTSGSASSSSATHGKSTLLHSVSAMVGAKQAAGVMRRRADKSAGATSVWPHALTTPSTSPNKDPASRAAKSPSSSVQKSKLSTRPAAEKTAAAASPKPRTQKATTGAGKNQAASSSARNPGAMAKGRTGLEISVPSIQRTTSVPAAAPKAEEQDVQLLMEEFDEMESISTPSIEEHLQQRLPDPVDITAYAASEHAPILSEPSSNREEHKNGQEVITEHMFPEEKHENLNGGGNADAGLDSGVAVAKEAAGETELKEAVIEAGLNEAVNQAELNEAASEAGLKESVSEVELKGAVDEPKLNEADVEIELKEADSETELKDPELVGKEEAKANDERIILPATKIPEVIQRWRKDDGRSNEVTEERRSKTAMQEKRNKVLALVGKFETAMSGRE